MATIDNLVTQGSVMPDNLRSDTARASLEYKNQLKNAGDIYVGTGTKITNNEAGVSKEIYVTEGKNIQKALNEDIFRVDGKNNIGLTNSDLSGYSNNIGIGKDISVQNVNNIVIGNFANSSGSNTVTIGLGAATKANYGVAIGLGSATNSEAVSGIAIGRAAKAQAPNAVQIGDGVNSVENSLQFYNTQIIGGDGHVNATKINGVLSTDIFEGDKKTAKNATNATNVTGSIGGRDINDIFVGETATVRTAELLAATATVGDPYTPVYFFKGAPAECAIKYYAGTSWDSVNNQVRIPYEDFSFFNKQWLLITLPTVSNKVTMTPIAGGAAATASNNIDDIKVVQGTVNHYLLSQSDQTTHSFNVVGVADKIYTITVDGDGFLVKGPDDQDQNSRYKYTFPYVMVQFIKVSWSA